MPPLVGPNGETPSLSTRIQRDEGFKKLKAAQDDQARRNGADSVEFKDFYPNGDEYTAAPGSFVEAWPLHLHVNGRPCPFRIVPAPGAFVCLPCKKPERSPEGIILPDITQDPDLKRRGIVIAVGDSWTNEHGIRMQAPPLKPGDEVLYSKHMIVEPAGKDWPINPVPFDCYLGKIVRAKPAAQADTKTPGLALTP